MAGASWAHRCGAVSDLPLALRTQDFTQRAQRSQSGESESPRGARGMNASEGCLWIASNVDSTFSRTCPLEAAKNRAQRLQSGRATGGLVVLRRTACYH